MVIYGANKHNGSVFSDSPQVVSEFWPLGVSPVCAVAVATAHLGSGTQVPDGYPSMIGTHGKPSHSIPQSEGQWEGVSSRAGVGCAKEDAGVS